MNQRRSIRLTDATDQDLVTLTNFNPTDRDFVYEFRIMGFDACLPQFDYSERRVKVRLGEHMEALLERFSPHAASLLGRWRVTLGTDAVIKLNNHSMLYLKFYNFFNLFS